MYLQETKKPKWKEKEERYKSQSFDYALTELGINGAFLNAKAITRRLETPTQKSAACCDDLC